MTAYGWVPKLANQIDFDKIVQTKIWEVHVCALCVAQQVLEKHSEMKILPYRVGRVKAEQQTFLLLRVCKSSWVESRVLAPLKSLIHLMLHQKRSGQIHATARSIRLSTSVFSVFMSSWRAQTRLVSYRVPCFNHWANEAHNRTAEGLRWSLESPSESYILCIGDRNKRHLPISASHAKIFDVSYKMYGLGCTFHVVSCKHHESRSGTLQQTPSVFFMRL